MGEITSCGKERENGRSLDRPQGGRGKPSTPWPFQEEERIRTTFWAHCSIDSQININKKLL
jgi:hypothetical protein